MKGTEKATQFPEANKPRSTDSFLLPLWGCKSQERKAPAKQTPPDSRILLGKCYSGRRLPSQTDFQNLEDSSTQPNNFLLGKLMPSLSSSSRVDKQYTRQGSLDRYEIHIFPKDKLPS